MKIILSRKGFDSAAGGYPSPILPDGTLLSIPIPDIKDKIRYSELNHLNTNYYNIMEQLKINTLKLENKKIDFNKNTTCHFDPDIRIEALERIENWRGILGQIGTAETHLRNQNVGENDLFLFFGWFRRTIIIENELTYDPNDKIGKHIIFGYLQIDKKIKIQDTNNYDDWLLYHPHLTNRRNEEQGNTIYIAKKELSFLPDYKGYGIFNYRNSLVLTKENESRSKWNLPNIFKSAKISYHTDKSWKNNYFQSTARGQEFVVEENSAIEKWVKQIIIENYRK